jgi:putative transposase
VIAVRSGGMITILSVLVSVLSLRFRSRASLELELVALRHQLIVLRRQRPRRLRFHSADRLLWVCLYRVWPRVLDALVLVKPATLVKWHRKGFRIYCGGDHAVPDAPRRAPKSGP